jgi:hypothetical protein
VKQRLGELQELLDSGCVTKDEFALARANILREAGIDLAIHQKSGEPRHDGRISSRYKRRSGGQKHAAVLTLFTLVVAGCAAFIGVKWNEMFGTEPVPYRPDEIVESISSPFLEVPDGRADVDIIDITRLPDEPHDEDGVVDTGATERSGDSQSQGQSQQNRPASPPRPAQGAASATGATGYKPVNNRRGVVSARSVTIRSTPDPSRRDNIAGWGAAGDRFVATEEAVAHDGSRWYKVRYENGEKSGWINASLLKMN